MSSFIYPVGGGGPGVVDLDIFEPIDPNQVDITNTAGNGVAIPGATGATAGVMVAGDKLKLDQYPSNPGVIGTMLVDDGTSWVTLPPGVDGQFLGADTGAVPLWAVPAGGGNTPAAPNVIGTMLVDGGSGLGWVALPPGTTGEYLNAVTSGLPIWAGSAPGTATGIQATSKIIDVVQNGSAIQVWQNGVIIDSGLVATISDHVGALQAANDACMGTYSAGSGGRPGFGGGGLVRIGPGRWQFNASGGVVCGAGVNWWSSGSIDRSGLVPDNMCFYGTLLNTTTGFPAGTPIFSVGVSVGGGARSTTNPHGVTFDGICVASDSDIVSYGWRLRDTSQVRFLNVKGAGFGHNAGGAGSVVIRIESTAAPDDGSIATEIIEPYFTGNDGHLETSGTGSTDGRCVGGRWLQHKTFGARFGAGGGGGGWQVVGGGHWTTGDNAFHVDVQASPCMIAGGNYFDTTGTGTAGDNYHIRTTSGGTMIDGNHFKCSSSGGPDAPIFLSGNGRKATVQGNNLLTGSGTLALVELSAVGESFSICGNNCDNDGAAWVAPAVTSAGVSVVTDAGNKRWVNNNSENAMS